MASDLFSGFSSVITLVLGISLGLILIRAVSRLIHR